MLDPQASVDELYVSTKRLVLSFLKVQPGDDLEQALLSPYDESLEVAWQNIRMADLQRQQRSRGPSNATVAGLDDITQYVLHTASVRSGLVTGI